MRIRPWHHLDQSEWEKNRPCNGNDCCLAMPHRDESLRHKQNDAYGIRPGGKTFGENADTVVLRKKLAEKMLILRYREKNFWRKCSYRGIAKKTRGENADTVVSRKKTRGENAHTVVSRKKPAEKMLIPWYREKKLAEKMLIPWYREKKPAEKMLIPWYREKNSRRKCSYHGIAKKTRGENDDTTVLRKKLAEKMAIPRAEEKN